MSEAALRPHWARPVSPQLLVFWEVAWDLGMGGGMQGSDPRFGIERILPLAWKG